MSTPDVSQGKKDTHLPGLEVVMVTNKKCLVCVLF